MSQILFGGFPTKFENLKNLTRRLHKVKVVVSRYMLIMDGGAVSLLRIRAIAASVGLTRNMRRQNWYK